MVNKLQNSSGTRNNSSARYIHITLLDSSHLSCLLKLCPSWSCTVTRVVPSCVANNWSLVISYPVAIDALFPHPTTLPYSRALHLQRILHLFSGRMCPILFWSSSLRSHAALPPVFQIQVLCITSKRKYQETWKVWCGAPVTPLI